MKIDLRQTQYRTQAEDDAREQHQRECIGQNGAVQVNLTVIRQVAEQGFRKATCAPSHHPVGKQQGKESAGQKQEKVFGQELPCKPPLADTQRQANCHLSPAVYGARQNQIRHICTGDQKKASDDIEKDTYTVFAALPGNSLRISENAKSKIGVGRGKAMRQVASQAVQVRSRLLKANTRTKAGEHRDAPIRPVLFVAGVVYEGRPYAEGAHDGYVESRGHDSDYTVITAVQTNVSADDPRIASVAPLPDAVADDRHFRVPCFVRVLWKKSTAHCRAGVEDVEKLRRGTRALHALWREARAAEIEPGEVEGGDGLQDRAACVAKVQQVCGRQIAGPFLEPVLKTNENDSLGVRKGRRGKDPGIDETKDADIAADSQRKGKNCR